MIQQMLGIPGMSYGLAKTFINEAFQKVQNEQIWSWQIKQGEWLTPPLLGGPNTAFLSPGTITVAVNSTQILGDAVATQAWVTNVPNPSLLTQQQIRIPYYSLYDIISIGAAGTVAYLSILTAGSGQTPGTYTVNGTGGSGSGAQATIVVNSDGTVTLAPTITNQGTGYTNTVGGLPTFTLAAGGTPATFSAVLNAILNINRPWLDPAQTNGNYLIYQAYYPAPAGFKRMWAVRDVTNNNSMDFWSKTQVDLANDDPQRTIFDQPYFVVPYDQDTRPGSATYGQLRYELWPHPISQLPYPFTAQCNWPALSLPTDTLPYPLTEEIVKFRTLEQIALWKESQKGDEQERGSGANWQFLTAANRAEYKDDLRNIRIMDRQLVELYFAKAQRVPPFFGEPFATVNGSVNVGWF